MKIKVSLTSHMRSFVVNKLYNGESGLLVVRLKFAPAQSGPYKITVTTNMDLQVCDLQVRLVICEIH